MRRPANSQFVNNYFKIGLGACEENMAIQPVFNEQKAITYMCLYMSKVEDNFTNAIKQALKTCIENICGNFLTNGSYCS